MKPTKRLCGPCAACGRSIEYPAHLIGTTTKCPYCGESTELVLDTPEEEPSIPRRAIVFTVITALVLVLGLIACFIGLRWAEKHSRSHQPTPAVPVEQ